MAIKIVSENITNEWASIINFAAGSEDQVLDDIKQRIEESDMPGTYCGIQEAQSGGMFGKKKQDFLICENEAFKDYRFFIGATSYGKHLYVCWYLTCQPGAFKQMFAEHQTGHHMGLSMPSDPIGQQGYSAWQSIVHDCVYEAVREFTKQGNGDPSRIRRESRGLLQIW